MSENLPTVLVPAGLPLLEAAAWIGESSRLELDLHVRLTRVMRHAGPARSPLLWEVRAHRAEVSEAWHRRLPELREMPRDRFMGADTAFGRAGGGDSDVDPADDLTWLVDALEALVARYRSHLAVAVGPADGPTADTLGTAIGRAEGDIAALRAA